MNLRLLFGREPAAWLAAVAGAVKLVSAFWLHMSTTEQATVNTVAAAVVALLIAVTAHDSVGPALISLVQAGIAAAVGFGLHWSADTQATVLTMVTALVAMWTRTQVTAKVAAGGQRVPAPVQDS